MNFKFSPKHNLKIRIDREIGLGGMDWIHLAQDRDSGN
jgi:hypothetical protein